MFDSPLSASAYDVLGVDPAADDEALRKAYRLRLRQTHPDTGGDAAVFIQVQRAWELVGTAEARAAYDRGHGFGEAAGAGVVGLARPAAPGRHPTPGAVLRAARRLAPRALPRPDPRVGRAAASRSRTPTTRRSCARPRANCGGCWPTRSPRRPRRASSPTSGMGYTVWHDVAAPVRGGTGDDKLDHIVLSPSGLYAVLSEDFGGPVGVRRGELTGDARAGRPGRRPARAHARSSPARRACASAARSSCCPTRTSMQAVTDLGRVRGIPVVAGRARRARERAAPGRPGSAVDRRQRDLRHPHPPAAGRAVRLNRARCTPARPRSTRLLRPDGEFVARRVDEVEGSFRPERTEPTNA